jgi:hypothetical protein
MIFVLAILGLIVAGLFAWNKIQTNNTQQAAIENPETKMTGEFEETIIEEFEPPTRTNTNKVSTPSNNKPTPLRKITTRKYNVQKESKPATIPEPPKKSFYLSVGAGINIHEPTEPLWGGEVGYFPWSSDFSIGVQYIDLSRGDAVFLKATLYF